MDVGQAMARRRVVGVEVGAVGRTLVQPALCRAS